MNYYLAVDIGASSGRHILGWIEDGKLRIKELYRFKNGAKKKGAYLVWDTESLFEEILTGIAAAKEYRPKSVSVDTWGVDYAILGKNGRLLHDVISYRDERTLRSMPAVHGIIPARQLYSRNGLQINTFNTVYQLFDDKENNRFAGAERVLLLPDYFHFLLSGVAANEYTIASTTGLIDVNTRTWDEGLFDILGLPILFSKPCEPSTVLGAFRKNIAEKVGYSANVVLPASHDTASAVTGTPLKDGAAYISSGTWSLMGVERKQPKTDDSSFALNFTNEGGAEGTLLYLTNIMGLWMIQNVKAELKDEYSFARLAELAEAASGYAETVDVNDQAFFAPASMAEAVRGYISERGGVPPGSVGELAFCIFNSLAKSYQATLSGIETSLGLSSPDLHIMGGGCQNLLLNRLTESATGKRVLAGPVEATALGNLLMQLKAAGEIKSVAEGRAIIAESV